LWILTTNVNKHNNNVSKKHKEKCLDWCSWFLQGRMQKKGDQKAHNQ
jgi:hypothetical protein